VLSVDWRVSLVDTWKRCGEFTGVQGNLDPVAALAGGTAMEKRVNDILEAAKGHGGHVFSLGHGVLRGTDPQNLRRIVKLVHETTKKTR
jgi:uroporphyrinogen decarboxylase